MSKRRQTTLVKFLRAWLAWAEADAPDSWFNLGWGLCGNADIYALKKGVSGVKLTMALDRAFEADGLSATYPFGYCRYWGYAHEERTYVEASCANLDGHQKCDNHRDPVRLAWVRYYLARFDAGLV